MWLVLAAGASRRFGGDKLLAAYEGAPLILHCLNTILATRQPLYVVTRPDNLLLQNLLEEEGFAYGCCPNADQGMGSSLAWGVRQNSSQPWLGVLLADMPLLQPDTVQVLLKVWERRGMEGILLPCYQNRPGHPVFFSAPFFPELQNLTGDAGARSVIARHADQVTLHRVADPGVTIDIDTRQRLAEISDEVG